MPFSLSFRAFRFWDASFAQRWRVARGEEVSDLTGGTDAWPQLNKLAYWMATGSGKTLVMHANILPCQHYLEEKSGDGAYISEANRSIY